MPRLNAASNAKTTLAQNIDASATSFDVTDASVFPAVPFRVTVLDSSGNPVEIMEVGTITSNTLSDVQRGLEGTSAVSHNSGVYVEGRFTAGMYDELVSQDEFIAHLAETVTKLYNVVEGYGADPTGTEDSTSAIQAAINDAKQAVKNMPGTAIQSVKGAVFFPSGTYILGSGITNYQGVLLVGASQGSVVLEYTGSGDAITYDTDALYAVQMENMNIYNTGSGVRGIYVPETGDEQAIRSCSLRQVTVIGFDENIHIADSWTFTTEQCLFKDAGSYNARIINATAQYFQNTRFDVAGIDSVLIENTSQRSIAPVFDGCIFQDAQRWGIRGVDIVSVELYGCYFEANSQESSSYGDVKIEDSTGEVVKLVKVSGGYFTATGGTVGQTAISIDRARHVSIDTNIDSPDYGIGVELGANVENAVVMGNNAASTPISSSATRLTRRLYGEDLQFEEKVAGDAFSTGNEFSIADDSVATIEFDSDSSRGIIALAGNASGAEHALFAFRVGSSVHISPIGSTANVETTTGALTGTDGTDGSLTISAHTDNKIYIENRTGSSRTYQITVLSNGHGKISSIT